MKKITLFVSIVAFVACSVSAAVKRPYGNAGPVRPHSVVSSDVVPSWRVPSAHTDAMSSAQKSAKSSAADEPEIIYFADGESRYYTNLFTGFSNTMFGIFYDIQETCTEIVYDPDGTTVYIKDIAAATKYDTYVKGTLQGDIITVELPQCVYSEFDDETQETYYYYINVCEIVQDGEYKTFANVQQTDENKITYKVDGDNITLLLNDGDPDDVDTPPARIAGLVGDTTPGLKAWTGFGDAYQRLSLFDEEAVLMPEDITVETWFYTTAEGYAGTVGMGFDDGKVYIRGLSTDLPDVCIVGTYDSSTQKITFPVPQYMGMDNFTGQFIYMTGVHFIDYENDEFEFVDNVTFNFDPSAKRATVDGEDIDILVNIGKTSLYYIEDYLMPEFFWQEPALMNADPNDPEYVDMMEYDDYYGYGYIKWSIPATNVDGHLLDPSRLFYRVYFDDDLYTFTPEIHMGIGEDITDVPYYFTDLYDILIWGETHEISFYDNYTSFGIQSFFSGTDGTLYSSNIVTVEPGGLDTTIGNSHIVRREWFNLQGLPVSNPGRGVFIERATRADGSVIVTKRLVK